MDGRRGQLVDPGLDGVPSLERIEPVESRVVRATGSARVLGTAWAAALGVGWPLAYVIAVAIEPAPAHPDAVPSVLASTAALGFMLALWTTVLLAVGRHPSTGLAGSVAGGIAAATIVTCPVSGHHELGLWWFGQLALMTTMLALSLTAAGRHRRPRSRVARSHHL